MVHMNLILDTIVDHDDDMGDAAQAVASVLGFEYLDGDSAYVAADGDGEYEMAAYVRAGKALIFGANERTPIHMKSNAEFTLLIFQNQDGLLDDIPASAATIVGADSIGELIAEVKSKLAA